MENLQPQEVVLGLLGEYVQPEESVWSGGLVRLLGDLGFSPAASRIALNRVVGRGLLQTSRSGRFVFYRISPRLEGVHSEARRRLFADFTNAPWNADWTLVWYVIPEERRLERARFGRWLTFRGFGALQDGTRIAPGDRVEDVLSLIEQMKLEPFVKVFVGRLGTPASLRSLIAQVWNLDDLKQRYAILAEEFRRHRHASGLKPREAFVVRTRAIEMFRQTVSRDPQLPDSVVGMNWQRADAIQGFHALRDSLAPGARDYFWTHADRPQS